MCVSDRGCVNDDVGWIPTQSWGVTIQQIVDADMEAMPQHVMNRVRRASEAGMWRGLGM